MLSPASQNTRQPTHSLPLSAHCSGAHLAKARSSLPPASSAWSASSDVENVASSWIHATALATAVVVAAAAVASWRHWRWRHE